MAALNDNIGKAFAYPTPFPGTSGGRDLRSAWSSSTMSPDVGRNSYSLQRSSEHSASSLSRYNVPSTSRNQYSHLEADYDSPVQPQPHNHYEPARPREEVAVKKKKSSAQRRCDRIFDLMLREICGGDCEKLVKCFEQFIEEKAPNRSSKVKPQQARSYISRSEESNLKQQRNRSKALTSSRVRSKSKPSSSRYPVKSSPLPHEVKGNVKVGRSINLGRSHGHPSGTTPTRRTSGRHSMASETRTSTAKTRKRSKSIGHMSFSKSKSMGQLDQSASLSLTTSFSEDRRGSVNQARKSTVSNKRLAELQRAMRAYRNNPTAQTRRRLERAKAAVEGKHVEAKPTSLNPMGALVGVEHAPSKYR